MLQQPTLMELILQHPDMFVGSVKKHTKKLWVYEKEEMVYRSISYVPALYKIFDEILANAADNKHRDPSMSSLKVTIDPEANTVSVYNNGDGVPVMIHPELKIYVPELLFGRLDISINYDVNVKKTTSGMRGCGAKVTNIYSTEFVVETADGSRLKKYKQVFTNNMGTKSVPVITKCKRNENWTKVTFKPDLNKFKMASLEEDVVVLMKTRVLEMAGCLGKSVKVKFNGSLFPINSFKDYVDLYLKSAEKYRQVTLPRTHYKVGDRWEICVSLSDDGQFQQVSFVNSIATTPFTTTMALRPTAKKRKKPELPSLQTNEVNIRDRILSFPKNFVGSVDRETQNLWVYENEEMVYRSVSYVPGLLRIFDEILTNAADNGVRDSSMSLLSVNIDVNANCISIFNDGVGLSLEKEDNVLIMFGKVGTGTTANRSGFGAKLTNIFSKRFVIETVDGHHMKRCKQKFNNNMGDNSKAKIDILENSENWTMVTFEPDLEKFKMKHLDSDIVGLMKTWLVLLERALQSY